MHGDPVDAVGGQYIRRDPTVQITSTVIVGDQDIAIFIKQLQEWIETVALAGHVDIDSIACLSCEGVTAVSACRNLTVKRLSIDNLSATGIRIARPGSGARRRILG